MQSSDTSYSSSRAVNLILRMKVLHLVEGHFIIVLTMIFLINRNSVSMIAISDFYQRLFDVLLGGRSFIKCYAFLHIKFSTVDKSICGRSSNLFWAICWVIDLNAHISVYKIGIWHAFSTHHLSMYALREILFSLIEITLSIDGFCRDFIFFYIC